MYSKTRIWRLILENNLLEKYTWFLFCAPRSRLLCGLQLTRPRAQAGRTCFGWGRCTTSATTREKLCGCPTPGGRTTGRGTTIARLWCTGRTCGAC